MSLNIENLIKITPSIESAKIKLDRASSFLNTSKIVLNKLGEEKGIDKNLIYTNIYDTVRIACEGLLLLNGFKVGKGKNNHFNIIISAKEIFNGELANEFIRFQKMRKARNEIDYGALIISENSLSQAITDTEILLQRINDIIRKENSQNTLI